MAIIQSALLSKGRGSAGSVTFRRLNGKTVVSEKPLTVGNPDTSAQRGSRMLFMLGANAGWALSPYFAARPKLTEVRNSTGVSARGSKLLPLQAYIQKAIKTLKEDGAVKGQISETASRYPSKELNNAAKRLIVYGNSSPVYQALEGLNATGLPKENSEFAINGISVVEGAIQVPMTIKPMSSVKSVRATIYVVVVAGSDTASNRYMITKKVHQSATSGGVVDIQSSIQIPERQSIHRIIVEAVPLVGVSQGSSDTVPQSDLTIGDDLLINGLNS